ncbi:MAG: cytochrome c [Gammaproteobacteria bacterium]|nr:cytochrome c [Gammaproteobacteria bacterium]
MKKLLIASALVATAGLAHAGGDAAAGEQKAAACNACHGVGGNSTIAANPILAGQHRSYLVQALNAYKNGTRTNPIMKGMAAGLSDQDIEDLAVYFASQDGLK